MIGAIAAHDLQDWIEISALFLEGKYDEANMENLANGWIHVDRYHLSTEAESQLTGQVGDISMTPVLLLLLQ